MRKRNSDRLLEKWIGDLLRDMNVSTLIRSHGKFCILDLLNEPGMSVKDCSKCSESSCGPAVNVCSDCIGNYLNELYCIGKVIE